MQLTMIKRVTCFSLLSLCCLAQITVAQAPAIQDQGLATMVSEIRAQQAQIADNQSKIEAKLATITESVRVARIYSSRAGH